MTSQTSSRTAAPDAVAQVRRAKGIYVWLWLSPVVTLTTLGFLWSIANGIVAGLAPAGDSYQPGYQALGVLIAILAVLGSALWHLVLLAWALDRRSEFVRWHGRQALLLAGARTAVALVGAVMLSYGPLNQATFYGFISLLALWFFGTLWGRSQAANGECSLMRWSGHGASLPLRVTAAMNKAADAIAWGDTLLSQGREAEADLAFRKILFSDAAPATKALAADRLPMPDEPGGSATADILVAMLRFSEDPERRRAALDVLDNAGLVEDL